MCTIFPCNNVLCCGLLTHAQYQDILWVSAISEQITSLILRLLIHSVFFIKRCFWTCLLGGVFFSFCFRPPALVASFKDHFTRGRSIRFLCKLLGIGFSWSCEKNMKSTGCRSWLQWFPGGGEEVITTDKPWSRNNEQWTGRCLQNWRANSCSFNSLHSCFCTLFLCRKKKSYRSPANYQEDLQYTFPPAPGEFPFFREWNGDKPASSSPPLVGEGWAAIVMSEICFLSKQKYGHEMWKQETSYETQNWWECVCICVWLFRCSSGKIMQDSCKTNRIVSLNQYCLSCWHFMNTRGRRCTVLATSPVQPHAAMAGVPPSMQAVKDGLHHLDFWGLFSRVALRGSPLQLLHRSHQCTPFLFLLRANSLEGLGLAGCHHHFSTWFCCCFFTTCVWTVYVFGFFLSFCAFTFDHINNYFVLVEISSFHQ